MPKVSASPHVDTAIQVERVPVDRLLPSATNARTHTREQVSNIAASMREFGWTNPILVGRQGDA